MFFKRDDAGREKRTTNLKLPLTWMPQNFEAQRDLIRYEMNAPGVVSGRRR